MRSIVLLNLWAVSGGRGPRFVVDSVRGGHIFRKYTTIKQTTEGFYLPLLLLLCEVAQALIA